MKITGGYRFDKAILKNLLSENYPLLSILVGFMLVSLSIGPYQNGDTAWEHDAVSGVIKYGLPYANGLHLMDQPPLGFYIQAAFSKFFGLSINNGTFLVTLFGLGCVILLYGIGRMMYNKTTGFFAALLFAFSPWHLIMSRAFLIDAQCLFFSLFSLFAGILAVRRGSFKLFVVSGIIFAAAFNTKLYAVFALTPLLAFLLVYLKPKNVKRIIGWLAAFSVPILLGSFLWYQVITGLGMSAIFWHTDLAVQSASTVVPSYFFVSNFLINYGLGWFFIDAAILSLLFCLARRRLFGKFVFLDLTCLAAILCAISVNMYLGVTLDLKAPYLNAVKYDYQALPFFSLLAGSLVPKSVSLFNTSEIKTHLGKMSWRVAALVGLALVAAALLYNMQHEHIFSTADFIIFRVEPTVNVGYSLFNYAPISSNSILMIVQYVGFAVALSGVLWIGRRKLGALVKR